MFFRYWKGCRIPIDLDGIFEGSCFIAGGAPSLLKENLELLKQPGITVISMNNTASRVPTDFWVCADKPKCYSERILKDPKLMKFAMISRKDLMVGDKKMMELPNMYFYGANDKYFNVYNLLNEHRDCAWWKNVFPITLQIAYKLGFRKVYLIGCGFKISKDAQYSYATNLTDHQVKYNTRTYNSFAEKMKLLKPHFKEKGFEVISCTPNSLLNDIYPTMSFEDAVEEALKDFPKKYNTTQCYHSSEMRKGNLVADRQENIEALKEMVKKSKVI